MVPTTVTSTVEELYKTLDNIKTAKKNNADTPNILGLHLEGPYISMEQRGAQDPKFIKNPDRKEYLEILSKTDDIVRWTIAPELEGALELGVELKNRGIVASIGHSNAVYEQVLEAFEHGFTHVTHLYSGMSMVRRIKAYRYAGVVESAFLINDMTVEIIADGKHLPASLLKLIYNIKGADKICLVTDSMRAAGTSDTESILGSLSNGQRVIIEDDVAKTIDRASFAGSVATADRLVRTMTKIAQIPLLESVKMITYSPAKVMGIEKTKGTLAVGKDADVIVFNDNIEVSFVMINGKIMINEI
jgi:N-acetylglucosamine-6-phosphate deacetylase